MTNSRSADSFGAPSGPTRPTAVVLCEGNFGRIDGKTANGLVRHSDRYEILSVIDSRLAGCDTGQVLDGVPNGIPIVFDLAEALRQAEPLRPDWLIIGVAPTSGMLSPAERRVILLAMAHGLSIVNGLHEFLADDAEFVAAGALYQVEILDIRRPRAKRDLRMFNGRINDVACPRLAVLGTDGAIGKPTTATILTRVLNDHGLNAVLIGTGQTSIEQRSPHLRDRPPPRCGNGDPLPVGLRRPAAGDDLAVRDHCPDGWASVARTPGRPGASSSVRSEQAPGP